MKQIFALIAVCAAVVAVAAEVPPGTDAEMRTRTQPVGELCKSGQACGQATAASSGGQARTGEAIYNQYCSACHKTGVAGAPIHGNAEQWAPHLAKGKDVLWQSLTHGFKAMPPKGTCMNCSDEELHAALDYITKS